MVIVRTDNVIGLGRQELFKYGQELCDELLDRNDLAPPEYFQSHPYFERGRDGWGLKGFYRAGHVYVNLPKCRTATVTPGYSWSFPGYKADLTPVGVVSHETGHHVDALFGRPSLVGWAAEVSVTSYEPNRDERFAEALKIFITNPDMLRAGRPVRWKFITEQLGLDPGDLVPWEEVLRARGAHEKFLAAAKNWITRGQVKRRV